MTLEAYPVVLAELDVANELIKAQAEAINNLELQIEQFNILTENLNSEVANLIEQNLLHKKEIKRQKRKNTKTLLLGGGVLLGVIVLSN